MSTILYTLNIYICISVTFAGGLGQHCIGFSTRLQLRRYLQADHIWTELTHCDNLPPLEVQDVIEANCSRVCPRNALLDFEPDCYASLFVKRFRDFIYFVEHIMNIWTYREIPRSSGFQWPWLWLWPSCESHPNALGSPLAVISNCWKSRVLVSFGDTTGRYCNLVKNDVIEGQGWAMLSHRLLLD